MNRPIKTQIIRHGDKELLVTSVNLHGKHDIVTLPARVGKVFEELAPFAKNKRHFAYVRDFPEMTSARFPSTASLNDHEMWVSLPEWGADQTHIVQTFAEDLHHIVRLQHVGPAKTLGESLTLEATGLYYSIERSGVRPPWTRGRLSQHVYDQARAQWGKRKGYTPEVQQTWFDSGPLGKWIGHKLAYKLGEKLFAGGFDLERSLTVSASDLKRLLP